MSKYAKRTLDGLARMICEIEQQAGKAGQERDRMLAKAREWAQSRTDLMTQAANLREILSGIDSGYYADAFDCEPFDPNAEATRQQFTTGLRDAAAYLEATPQLDTGDRGHIGIKAAGHTPAERRADLDRIARIMGVEVEKPYGHSEYTNYAATLNFGPVYLYASVDVPNEPQAGELPQAAVDCKVLDERMTGMGDAAARGAEAVSAS